MAYKRDYAFRMNVMEETFEIRSCIEIEFRNTYAEYAGTYLSIQSLIVVESLQL